MSQKITHKFEMPDGTVAKRVSSGRRYTHVILTQITKAQHAEWLKKAEASFAEGEVEAAQDDAHFQAQYEKSVARDKAEWAREARLNRPLSDFTAKWQVTQAERHAEESLETFRGYAESGLENAKRHLAWIQEKRAVGLWECEGWSQTAKSAANRANTLRGKGYHVEVHEVTDIDEREVVKSKGPRTTGKLTKAQKALLAHVTAASEGAKLWTTWSEPTYSHKVAEVLVARDLIEARDIPTGRMVKRYADPNNCQAGTVEVEQTETRYFLKGASA